MGREEWVRCKLVHAFDLPVFASVAPLLPCARPLHRETVFCREEAPPETGARATFVVEATTANGACTLRVAALPLPAPMATALDQNADLLRLGFTAAKGSEQQAVQAQQQQQAAAAAAGAEVGSGMGVHGSDSLAAFGERLRQMATAAEGQEQGALLPLLQRAWMFGPKRVGPNLLMAAPGGGGGGASNGGADGGPVPLFLLPPERVARLAKQHGGHSARNAVAAAAPAARQQHEEAAGEEAGAGGEEGSVAAQQRTLAVPLGFPEAGMKLGLASGDHSAASHASSAVSGLSDQLASGLTLSTFTGEHPAAAANGAASDGSVEGAAAGAAAAAAAAADAALGRSLEYVRYSVESGVAAGFQMASAAGPLCDEPFWGVAIQVEAWIRGGGGGAGGGGGGGGGGVGFGVDAERAGSRSRTGMRRAC